MDVSVAEEPRARRFALKTGEMAALEFGDATRPLDVIFCHANGFNARTYRSILAPLAADLRILAVDMRGHGATTLPTVIENRNAWNEFRDDLVALLELLDAPPVVLSGHSMGGTTCLLAEAVAPQYARRLVLFDPVIMPREMVEGREATNLAESPLAQGALRRRAVFESREAVMAAYRGRGAFRTWNDAQLADYVAAGFNDRPEGGVELACAPAWESSNFASHGHDSWGAFHAGRAPVRIFRATEGSTCRLDGYEAELAAIGRVSVETVPGTSHFLPMERPELVREALLAAVRAG